MNYKYKYIQWNNRILFSLLSYFIITISYLYDRCMRHSSKNEAFNVLRT